MAKISKIPGFIAETGGVKFVFTVDGGVVWLEITGQNGSIVYDAAAFRCREHLELFYEELVELMPHLPKRAGIRDE